MEIEETVNIQKLIEVAEELAYDGLINMAEMGQAPVHDILINGQVYTISVVIRRKDI